MHPKPFSREDRAPFARAFDLARRHSLETPGGYAALGVAGRSRPPITAAFLNGDLLDPAPRSSIASITKPMTATAVVQLLEDGLIQLDDPIATYLPEFRPEPPDGLSSAPAVTIRHVLTHTSGLADLPDEVLFRLEPTPAATVRAMHGQQLRFTPGSAWSYASECWYLLSAIIEHVSGRSFAEFLRERVFSPLGMAATSFDPREAGRESLPPGGAFGPPGLAPEERLELAARLVMPGGGLWSTPDDILRFGLAILSDGALDGARILSPGSVELMTRSHTSGIEEFGTGEPAHYGLGWGRPRFADAASPSAFGHTGASGSALTIDPERDLVVVYLRNWWGVSMDATSEAIAAVYEDLATATDFSGVAYGA